MDKYETATVPYKSTFFAVSVCECILAVLIIVTAITMKFFFRESFAAAKRWYMENATIDINISEFIKEVNGENKTVRN